MTLLTLLLILGWINLKAFNASKFRMKTKDLKPLNNWKLEIARVQPLHISQINYEEKNSVVSLSR